MRVHRGLPILFCFREKGEKIWRKKVPADFQQLWAENYFGKVKKSVEVSGQSV